MTGINYQAWSNGSNDKAMAIAYIWLMENAQTKLARLAYRFPLDKDSVEDHIQLAILAVCRSSLKRARDGSIPNGEHLERYLTVGAMRQVRFLFLQEKYRSKPLPLVERIQGSAKAPGVLADLAKLRRHLAGDFKNGKKNWSEPAFAQARYEAAEALLEAEAAQALKQTHTSPFFQYDTHTSFEDGVAEEEPDDLMMDKLNTLMDEARITFELVPDSPYIMELLQQRTCAPYLMWRLGLDYSKANRNTYYQLRKYVGAKLQHHPAQEELETLVTSIDRAGLVVLARRTTR